MTENDHAVAGAYDRWAAVYDSDRNATRDLDALVLRESDLRVENRDVLELGCGTGKNTTWLADRARHVTALDFSEGMLAIARRRVHQANVSFARHDVRDPWPADDASVDVVVGNLVLEHVRDLGPVFEETHRVLRAGGVAYFCELHPDRQARGGQAQFTDGATGERVLVAAHTHTVDEFRRDAERAGLVIESLTPHVETGAPAGAPPRLLVLRAGKR